MAQDWMDGWCGYVTLAGTGAASQRNWTVTFHSLFFRINSFVHVNFLLVPAILSKQGLIMLPAGFFIEQLLACGLYLSTSAAL